MIAVMDQDLLAAIGAALGLAGPYQVSPPPRDGGMIPLSTMHQVAGDAGNEVLAGVVDPDSGLVGWVEETVGVPRPGYLPVDITINLAGAGQAPLRVPIASYNPYFGCAVRLMRFAGGALVTVYTEKHRTIAARLAPSSPGLRLLPIGERMVATGDLLCHMSDQGGAEVLDLASFEPCLPLPGPAGARFASFDVIPAPGGPLLRWAEQARADAPPGIPEHERGWRDARVCRWRLPGPSQVGFPDDPDEFWARLRTVLGGLGLPGDAADILIGAVCPAYWHSPVPAAQYGRLRTLTEPPPWWFPAAWYHFLSASPGGAEASRRWLACLERLAADGAACDEEQATGGWSPEWSPLDGAEQLALRQLQLRAPAIAAACRAGRLPGGHWHAWRDGKWPYQLALEAFPPGFISAWSRLPAQFRPATP